MMEKILTDVVLERFRQDEKFGRNRKQELTLWYTILGEEVGEVAEAILGIMFGGATKEELRAELIQVAAVAVAMIEQLDDER